MKYTTIAIIYNPNSTGSSEALARDLEEEIRTRLPKQKVERIATDYPGHGEELAYSISTSSKTPLIISSSGDGGYNELVNGAIKAQKEGAHPTTGLLPAGNANDHHRNLHDKPIIDRIINNDSTKIDLLKLTGSSQGKHIERYAHSYIGFGLTSAAGKKLNKTKLNPITESLAVLHTLFTLKPVRLKIGKEARDYESVILSNISGMSKYLKISQASSVTDGKFEVTIAERRSKPKLILMLLKASFANVKEDQQVSNFLLKTIHKTLVQVDGEISELDANSDIHITLDKQVLRCIV